MATYRSSVELHTAGRENRAARQRTKPQALPPSPGMQDGSALAPASRPEKRLHLCTPPAKLSALPHPAASSTQSQSQSWGNREASAAEAALKLSCKLITTLAPGNRQMGKGQALGAARTLPVLADCHKPTSLLPSSPILPFFPTSPSFCQSLKYAVPGIKQAVAFCKHACCFPAISGCVFGVFCPRPPRQALSRNFSPPGHHLPSSLRVTLAQFY